MSSFHERLHQAIIEYGGKYDPVMRRSFQTVLMFEANRCLKDKLPSLRPFQRKLAVFDQAVYLLEEISGESSLVGLKERERWEEILWRTGTSREPLNPETMWSRVTRLPKDVEKVAEQVREFISEKSADTGNNPKKIKPTSTHEEIYRLFVENIYDKNHPNIVPGSEDYPIQFEYTHNHLFLAYKMYYRKGYLDKNFPKPSQREIIVPRDKPEGGLESYRVIPEKFRFRTHDTTSKAIASAKMASRRLTSKVATKVARNPPGTVSLMESPLVVAAGQKASEAAGQRIQQSLPLTNGIGEYRPSSDKKNMSPSPFSEQVKDQNQNHNQGSQDDVATQYQKERRRREVLREVRDHMDLLSQFEGLVDSEIIKKRKRALFLSLPPPPPPYDEGKEEEKLMSKSSERQGSSSETESDDGKRSDQNNSMGGIQKI